MHTSRIPWKRRSLPGSVQLDSYEQVPLMEDTESPRSSLIQHNAYINDKPPPDSSNKLRTIGDLLIVFLVLLLSETARGIVLPTMSPYVNLIGGNAVMLGYAVAAFSVGRFASTIGLGYLSTRLSYKKVLAGSVAICVVGNFMYGLAFFLGIYFMLASRFLTGFGAGTLSVIRAYVAHVTTTKERTSFMSILGAVQFLGFAIMPGAGSLLAYIPEFSIAGAPFNKFTMPGYVLAITSLALLLLIIFEFKNPPPLITETEDSKFEPPTQEAPPKVPTFVSQPPNYHSPVLGSIYHPQSPHFNTGYLPSPHFPQQFVDAPFQPQFPVHIPSPHFSPVFQSHPLASPQFPAVIVPSPYSPQLHPQLIVDSSYPSPPPPSQERGEEPLLSSPSPPSSTEPQLSRTERFLIFGVFLILNLKVRLVLGIIETIATPVYMDLSGNKPGKDVEAGFVFGGLGLIGMGVLFLISYLSKHVSDFKILVSGLATMVLGSGLLIGDASLARFIVGCGFIWCIGYPLAQTIIVSMFSKMLGSKPQGTWMGWIGAMGSLGRVIGPIMSGFLLDRFGLSATMIFGTVVAVVSLATSLLLLRVKERLHK